jgi:hypothetical protein
MRPDNAAPIVAAARHRHELTRARAVQALRELDRTGAPVTFAAVAAKAGVSRSWLYAQPDIRDQIVRLREATSRSPAAPVPAAQRTTDASLLRRLEAAHAERRRLQEENTRLRQEIARAGRRVARALGEQRQTSGGNPSYEPPF